MAKTYKNPRKIFYITAAVIASLTVYVFKYAENNHHINLPFQSLQRVDYTVEKVIDGDTIQLSNGQKVRYIGIDAPEITKRKDSKWAYDPMPYGNEAKDFNRKLVEGKKVSLEFDVQKFDKYKRLLAYIYLEKEMVNLKIVEAGYAMLYTSSPNIKYAEKLLEAQKDARINKRGLWGYLDSAENRISTDKVKANIGKMKAVEGKVLDTHLTEKVFILKFRDNFKVVMFKNRFANLDKNILRSPDTYFKGRLVRVSGVIKEYKGSPEIILNDLSQMEILE